MKKQISEYKNRFLKIIFKYLNKDDCAVILFGSHANNNAHKFSDIDLMLMCKNKISATDFLNIKEELNNEVIYDVDIVDFNEVSDNIKKDFFSKRMEIWHIGKNYIETLKNLKKHFLN